MRIWTFVFVAVALFGFTSACKPRPASDAVQSEAPAKPESKDAPSAEMVVVSRGGVESSQKLEPLTPDGLAGSYRDPDAPEVLYEFALDGAWRATWQPAGGGSGLRMSGTYLVDGTNVGLQCRAFYRFDPLLRDYAEESVPPSPRPRCLFRIEGPALVMLVKKAAEPFVMPPFTARRLVKASN